jgi:glycosyltransferase involved in cell wall biosynthesis
MARIVLAEQEVWPFTEGGGIGRYVWTAATILAPFHEVTILTTAAHASKRDDPRVPKGVALEFVEEPSGDPSPLSTSAHAFSTAMLRAIRHLEPDVVEFGDYLGHGFATVHARRSGDPALRRTAVVIRAHTSGEMTTALNEAPRSEASAMVWAMERFAIRHADALLWPGGDVLTRYQAFYGPLRRAVRIPQPVLLDTQLRADGPEPAADGPLQMLYLNRLERRKGIIEVVSAVMASHADVQLTIVGGDTLSAPGENSMREHVSQIAAGDERVQLRDPVPHDEVAALIAGHHVVTVPTRWETFSHVVREALATGRPVLATPSGAIPDVVIPGRSGWLTRDLRRAVETMDIETANAMRDGARAALRESLHDPEEHAATYGAFAYKWKPASTRRRVDVVVAVRPGDAGLDVTVRSLASQRGAKVSLTLVADPVAMPSLPELLAFERVVVAEGGRVALWQKGVGETNARIVLLVPAGAELHPEFTERALAALDDQVDYVTSIVARGHGPWNAPIGGEAVAISGLDAGASVALVRRTAVTRPAATERELWSGLVGLVLQEPLVRRFPRRSIDAVPPPDGGAASAASVSAAFGDVFGPSEAA